MAVRPFIDTLRQIERGHFLNDLSEAQHEVVQGIQDHRKKGEITIKLIYLPEADGQLSIEASVTAKAPSKTRGRTIFFMTPEANLDINDPRQVDISDFQEVPESNVSRFREAQ